MSVVLLVRHGQASFGLGNYDKLSDHGRAQARQLGEVLDSRGIRIDRIVSGDLRRQRETADILASVVGGGRPVSIDRGWNEYEYLPLIARVKPLYRKHWLMVADLARRKNPGQRLQEILDRALVEWVDAANDSDATGHLETPSDLPVETFATYSNRIGASLDAVSLNAGTSLVVSSAGSITAAIAPLIGVPPPAWPALHRVMVNTSVTKVVRGQSGTSLISFNDHGHLEGVPGLQITYR